MSSMSSIFRRGGPLGGPRLLIALVAVIIILFYSSQPYNPPTQSAGLPTPHDGEKATQGAGSPHSSGSLGERPATAELKDEKDSLSDKFWEYMKGHSSHGQSSHSPIPHLEHASGAQPSVLTALNATSTDPSCAHLPSTEDLLIVVRTPASELYTQLPAHFFTTLRCAPFLLYSTVSQNIGPYTVYDSLANISDVRRAKHKDFELYDKLQEAQNAIHAMDELKEDHEHGLDKWSMIPHIVASYNRHPGKKWFIFIESDTYISLTNTMKWLDQMDSKKPIYAGAQVMIGDVELAHSGSGIILSNAAARELATLAKTRTEAWEEMVGNSCCGDKILAEALTEANITLHRSFPMLQGETPFSLDWSDRHWCRSSLTWHRMTAANLDMLWQFERDWVKKHTPESGGVDLASIPPMLFKDYFERFLVPLVRTSQNRSDWDNLSASQILTDESRSQFAHYSVESCRAACDLRKLCVQYAWQPNKCRLGNVVRLGESVDGDKRMKSGWIPQRVEKFGEQVGQCKERDAWILPGMDTQSSEDERKEREKKEEERKEQERLEEEKIEQERKAEEKKEEERKEHEKQEKERKELEWKEEEKKKLEEEAEAREHKDEEKKDVDQETKSPPEGQE
jgi:hypothetical protein